MDVLKIATAGNVDDGKSTLIGCLLYETNSLPLDKKQEIEIKSKALGYDYIDYSLATDGLLAEREQGITIDVAHLYFSTQQKRYIIADTPGHIEYTRNMITGASTSDLSILLIDARKGITEQTARHFYINNLLRTKHIVVAINKMDLVGYSGIVFDNIVQDFKMMAKDQSYKEQQITFIPISALKGDNVVKRSSNLGWYNGMALLPFLNQLKHNTSERTNQENFRFVVQTVIRPKKEGFHDFRGFAGKVYNSNICAGDEIVVFPNNTSTRIKDIYFNSTKLETAEINSSVVLTLEDEVEASRGSVFVKNNVKTNKSREVEATVCWMSTEPLDTLNMVLIQHNKKKIKARVKKIQLVKNQTFQSSNLTVDTLKLNEIAEVQFSLAQDILLDSYNESRHTGSFLIIDNRSLNKVGVGFIQ